MVNEKCLLLHISYCTCKKTNTETSYTFSMAKTRVRKSMWKSLWKKLTNWQQWLSPAVRGEKKAVNVFAVFNDIRKEGVFTGELRQLTSIWNSLMRNSYYVVLKCQASSVRPIFFPSKYEKIDLHFAWIKNLCSYNHCCFACFQSPASHILPAVLFLFLFLLSVSPFLPLSLPPILAEIEIKELKKSTEKKIRPTHISTIHN